MAVLLKDIESEMEEIQMLMKIWNKFYNILTTTFYNKDADINKLDAEFQQVKQVVAEHHGHFMKVIKKDFHIGQSVLTTVKRTISLAGFQDLSQLEINKTLIEWHEANILLNETLGSLECDRDLIVRGRTKNKSSPKGIWPKSQRFHQKRVIQGPDQPDHPDRHYRRYRNVLGTNLTIKILHKLFQMDG